VFTLRDVPPDMSHICIQDMTGHTEIVTPARAFRHFIDDQYCGMFASQEGVWPLPPVRFSIYSYGHNVRVEEIPNVKEAVCKEVQEVLDCEVESSKED